MFTSKLFESALAATRMAGFLLASPDGDGRANAGVAAGRSSGSDLTLHLAPGVEAAARAREALEQLDGTLERDLLQDVHLLVTELVTNSVRHAEAASGEPVTVEVKVHADRVYLAVEDSGRGFEPKPRAADAPRDSGWGLHLVECLSARWGVAGEGRTRVWLELARRSRVEVA